MTIKGIIDEDFHNYKKPSLFISCSQCTFKCDRLNQSQVCQNCTLASEPNIVIDDRELCNRYITNPITKAIVIGGLEPFDTDQELLHFVCTLRGTFKCNDDIVIYTGYTREELDTGWRDKTTDQNQTLDIWKQLQQYPNIIVKFGRYLINHEPHYDPVLGISLASNNQYAEVISNDN